MFLQKVRCTEKKIHLDKTKKSCITELVISGITPLTYRNMQRFPWNKKVTEGVYKVCYHGYITKYFSCYPTRHVHWFCKW